MGSTSAIVVTFLPIQLGDVLYSTTLPKVDGQYVGPCHHDRGLFCLPGPLAERHWLSQELLGTVGRDQLPKIPKFMPDQSSATADASLAVRFPSAGKCTSHLRVALGCLREGVRYGFDTVPRQNVALLEPPLLFHEHNLLVFLQILYLGSHNKLDYFPVLA